MSIAHLFHFFFLCTCGYISSSPLPTLTYTPTKQNIMKLNYKQQCILRILPATSSTSLVVLCSDGSVHLVHSDTLESRMAMKGPVLAMGVAEDVDGRLPRVVLAYRTGLYRHLRIAVYEIVPQGGYIPTWRHLWSVDAPGSIQNNRVCLAWAGDSVVCGIGNVYYLAWCMHPEVWEPHQTSPRRQHDAKHRGHGSIREILAVPDESSTHVAAIPQHQCALLLAEGVGVVINAVGEPIGNPVQLNDLISVDGIVSVGNHVVIVSRDGVHAFDLTTGLEIQTLHPLGDGDGVQPEKMLFVEGMSSPSEVAILATMHTVTIITSLHASWQVKELIDDAEIDDALEVIRKAEAKGEAWVENAYAQVALSLLQGVCRNV